MSLNALLTPLSVPLSRFLNLPHLPAHFSTVLLSFLAFHFIQWTSPLVFNKWFPESYGKASRRTKQGWAVRACSMFHALVVVPLAFRCLNLAELNNDKVWGTHPREGELQAFASGFLWDAMEECLVHFQDISLALHGILTLTGIVFTFRPLFGYSAVRFLLLEISTPLLNIHWFLDKTGRTGTTVQLVNGVALIVVFFLARICYGTFSMYTFMFALYRARAGIPVGLGLLYAVGIIALQGLNFIWMYKMLVALRKRFPTEKQKPKSQ